jgi:hypothetical protein
MTPRVRFPAEARFFSLLHSIPMLRRSRCEADHPLPPREELKNSGVIPPLPHMPSTHKLALIKTGRLSCAHFPTRQSITSPWTQPQLWRKCLYRVQKRWNEIRSFFCGPNYRPICQVYSIFLSVRNLSEQWSLNVVTGMAITFPALSLYLSVIASV